MENNTLRRVGRTVAGGLAALVLLSSCIKDQPVTPGTGTDGDTATVTFKVRVPGTNSTTTRGMVQENEMKVERIDVLLFTENGNYVSRAFSEEIGVDNSNASLKTFSVDLPKGNWNIVMLANSGNIINGIDPQLGQGQGYTKTGLSEKLVMQLGERWPTGGSLLFPMWCDAGMVTVSKGMDLTHKGWRLTRMVASVDVTVDSGADFELKEVFLYNYKNAGRLIPDHTKWAGTVPYPVETPANIGMVTAPTEAGTTVKGPLRGYSVEEGACMNEIYIFEYDNFISASQPKESDNRICLVVGGEYNNITTYYRIDFSDGKGSNQEFLNVLRNHKYIFKINKVTGHGYDTPEEAFISGSSNIEVNVNDWNESELNLWVIGQYYFSINSLVAEYMGQAQQDCELILRTNYDVSDDFVCVASLSEDYGSHDPSRDKPGWLRMKEPVIGTPVGDKYTILYDIDMNDSGDDRVAYIHIKTHTLEATVKVTQLLDRFTEVTLSPDGTIPAEGREITIRADVTDGGYFDSFVILAQDEDHGEILGAGTMPASGNDTYKTTGITIPEYWSSPSHTIPTERTVLFKYVGNTNAQWITIGELKQKSYWINVSCPEFTGGNDRIHADGGIYSVSVWGEWSDDTYFRFWDETNKQVISVKDNLGAGSASAAIPRTFELLLEPNPSVGERVIRLEYSVNGGNRWYIVGEREQKWDYRFNVTVDSFANGIPRTGGSYRITLTGNWPDLTVQALDVTNGTAVLCSVDFAAGNGEINSEYITIDANNSWNERNIAIVYYAAGSGQGYGTIGIQDGYQIENGYTDPVEMPRKGGDITVTLYGDFPNDSQVIVRASGTGISPNTVYGIMDTNKQAVLSIPNNDSGGDRTITFTAYVDSKAKYSLPKIQPQSNMVINVGNGDVMVAHSDVGDGEYFTWAIAMGINDAYYGPGGGAFKQPYYVPMTSTGCGGYEESGYNGKWRLPTAEELREIINLRDVIDLQPNSSGYWTSDDTVNRSVDGYNDNYAQRSMSEWVNFAIQYSSKSYYLRARCVRIN